MKICPKLDFDAVIEMINEKPTFKKWFFDAEKVLEVLEQSREIPEFYPPSSVETKTCNRNLD